MLLGISTVSWSWSGLLLTCTDTQFVDFLRFYSCKGAYWAHFKERGSSKLVVEEIRSLRCVISTFYTSVDSKPVQIIKWTLLLDNFFAKQLLSYSAKCPFSSTAAKIMHHALLFNFNWTCSGNLRDNSDQQSLFFWPSSTYLALVFTSIAFFR